MQRRFALKAVLATGALAVVTACAPAEPQAPDIVQIASTNDDFSTLVTALQAADLVETLQGEGPFTVFAPTNAAFEKLPAGTVETLLMPENQAQLAEILTYHVVPGAVTSAQLAGQRLSTATVQGTEVHIDGTGEMVTVEGANVILADIEASNGVIHVIDSVIMP
ncbi:fasciclin domain-containing protein [Limimaricola pyoseonensis]|uniref:Uncaracterized surface protein containing fasciclin (FAS1) repeats n=1 Tax=Limimaricola pyoseonensis TaxID=521013 RepID=A0A1G7AWA7_9RHOB|nr:fasciclin domain-containing protein [Limimaricola pyoseonensis]SDE18970.1 Uncaracterized surface protein containing fasciclin (FAS1) repeats [Limimaricola pyoseonensis]